MRGKLIVLEGVEGAGKTTQMSLLKDWLGSRLDYSSDQIICTREPGGTELGQQIRSLLLTTDLQEPIAPLAELLLYAGDRAQHIVNFIRPALDQGKIVICDRFTDSTIAYQGYGRNLDLNLIEQLNQIATQGLTSDLTLWLDIDVELGLTRTQKRGKADRMEQADLSFHQRVRNGFQQLAKQYPERIVHINADQSVEQVRSQIIAIMETKLLQWQTATN